LRLPSSSSIRSSKTLGELLVRNLQGDDALEREAKVLASLNHPNIAQIYGIDERALVMELALARHSRDRCRVQSLAVFPETEY
jgi:hypothetical protein